MQRPKKAYSFRLSDRAIAALEALQRRYNRSAADVLALLLHAAMKEADFSELEEWLELPL